MARPIPSSRMTTSILSLCVFMFICFSSFYNLASYPWSSLPPQAAPNTSQATEAPDRGEPTSWQTDVESIIAEAIAFIGAPIEPPYKDKFHDMGERTKTARQWVRFLDNAPSMKPEHKQALVEMVESTIGSFFPFLNGSPKYPNSKTPLSDLRSLIIPGSRGIVIPTGKETLRYAIHLIGSLQEVLHTNLTIQIVYAGDQDLPAADREQLHSQFGGVQFLDILTLIDDTTVRLATGSWAIKAFAALYAPFEQVLLLDADAVFVQPPENLYSDPSYISTGALLFHDRLLWQHGFTERHDWWKSQIHEPSATMNNSLVWTEEYAEEGDSGAVLVDKSRLDVLMGLLHVAWQNTHAVREEVTYVMTYGDKESWWFGFELSGSSYAFEKHYGAMVGWPGGNGVGELEKMCSFVIGHVDVRDELLWYNGGLLKNKRTNSHEFGLPTHVMVDGTWEKGEDRTEMSCMTGQNGKPLAQDAMETLRKCIALAQELDTEFGFV